MASTPLTIRVQLEAEVLIRIKGSDDLHVVGTVTYEPDLDIELVKAVKYQRNE